MTNQTPQLEDGYTKIANEILDAFCQFRIPGEIRQIIDSILRKTYGFNKKEDWISHSQIVQMTGMLKGNVSRGLSKAITHHLVIKSDNKLRLNKNYTEWVSFGKLSEVITNKVLSKVISPVIKSDKTVIRSEGNKRQYTKDNIQKKENTPSLTLKNPKSGDTQNNKKKWPGPFPKNLDDWNDDQIYYFAEESSARQEAREQAAKRRGYGH